MPPIADSAARSLIRACHLGLLCLVVAGPCPAAVELLTNGGFEWGDWEWVSGWGHQGHEVVREKPWSGTSCLHFSAAGAVRSLRYSYNGGPIHVTGSYRLRNVAQGEQPWYRFWITVNFYGAGGDGLGHADCLLADGTRDWTAFAADVTPTDERTRFIELSVALHNTTGEAWVDDLQMVADARLDGPDWPPWRFAERPYYTGRILPRPKQCEYREPFGIWDAEAGHDTVRLELGEQPGRAALFGADCIRWRLAACERFLRFNPQPPEEAPRVRVHLGRVDEDHIRRAARELRVAIPRLGPQGHMVRMLERQGRREVLAVGADDLGVAYAAASIVQMIGIEQSRLVLGDFDLVDQPTWPLRAGGDYGAIGETMMGKLAMCKVPVYSIQHRRWWRLARPDGPAPGESPPYATTLPRMQGWCERTGALELMFLLHIYTPAGRPADETGPVFDIASDQDIADLTDRLRWLYDTGFHIQMVCVDDYVEARDGQYVCKTGAERQRFGSIGRAHGYLMRRLWEALAPHCPELKLSFVSGPYSTGHLGRQVTQEAGERYLRELAEEMPDQ
ncbi:MAG TPA: hypothetical protein VM283_06220, partial [Armatimonadota bacterium]|nr:hypothetical protein [Armatimonadota bacterium]